ncbi:MAG TPA: phospholipase D-like domain-containing protein [Haliangiales bacterium]|nr:phospholipase D-like domain-containing protein [Haliangiales bacterium]
MTELVQAGPHELVYALHAETYTRHNDVRFLVGGGEVFPAMLDAIAAAERYVHLETYILRSDETGSRFADALMARAEKGVEVRLLYDAVGGLELSADYLAALANAGVKLVEYGPLAPWKARFRLHQRDHRKILVCDGKVAFTGGINIGNEYDAVENGGGGWHDLHARVEGPVVAELARTFRRNWLKGGGDAFPPPGDAPETAGTAMAQALSNEELRRRRAIRRAYLHAFRRARETIAIVNAYFIPDRGLRRVLFNAIRRGVKVSVTVPAESDVPAVQWASRHTYAALLKGGVRLYEWQWHVLHAKAVVVDGVWSSIGSYNLDARSLFHNLEVVLCIIDHAFGAKLKAQIDSDAALSREVDLAAWNARPLWRQLVEWLFYRFRFWL